MSRDDTSDSSDGGDSSSTKLAVTRRRLMQVTGGSLLGGALFGHETSTARAEPHDGVDPTPGDINWSTYIETPGVVGEYTEPPHVATTMPYGSLSAARAAERDRDFLTDQWLESQYVTSLDGPWQFDFATDLAGATADTSNYANWDTVYVPHTWNTDGYGDLGFYNQAVGFSPNDPPNVPSTDNSVGTYKREFTVPDGWTQGRQTYLNIGGAKAGYFVWVNDAYVGYKQGSMTPGEFNITDVVTEDSTNTVTIQVVRWTDGTYLEQQHMWRLAGIFRDVLLYSKPDVHVQDFDTVADLDSTYTDGTLEVDAALANHTSSQQSATVQATLYDPAGIEVGTTNRSVTIDAGDTVTMSDGVVTDHSTENNGGTVIGDPSYVSGSSGRALDFDGGDDWVDVGSHPSLDLSDALTLEAVVYGESLTGEQPMVVKGDTSYGLKMSGGDLQFFVYDGSWNTVTVAPPSGWSGSWHTVTGVYDGSSLRLYVDGTEIGATSFSGSVSTNGYRLGIGHNAEARSRYFGGRLDSVRVYDRALSSSEVNASRTGPDSSTRLWLDFEQTGPPLSMTVSNVDAWTAETPALYTLGIELIPSGASSATEAMVEKVGFRTIEVVSTSDGAAEKITVNGEAVTLAGTNRHDYSLDHGRHVPTERMRKEIELAKRNNANAIRCSHYPNRPDFYRLCDEYGIYLQDELNAEAHGNQSLVNDFPSYDPSFLDRFKRMVVRDKNFASITVWSTGNEAGLGEAHRKMADWVRSADPTRLVGHQDNAGGYGSGFGGTASFADINGIRYPFPGTIESMAGDSSVTKPVVMGEYQIMSGNGGGLLTDFYDVIHAHEQLQGGYIWMWNQHQLNATEDPLDGNLLSEDHRRAAIDDRSIAGHTALVNGSPNEVSGESGSALELDGTADWVDANHDDRIDITGELTVEAVVYGDGSLAGEQPFVVKGDTQYGLKMSDGDLQFFVSDGSNQQTASAAPPSGWDGSWHTLSGVYDGSAVRLYVDGSEIASTAFSGAINSNRYRVGIGHNTETAERYANVRVDSVRIFERALSSSEVGSLSSPDDSCRLWLDFELKEHHWGDPPQPTATVIDHRHTMPQLDVMKKAQQFVRFEANDLPNGDVDVTNVYDFTNTSQFDFSWVLKEDDTVIQSGTLNPSIAPGETQTVSLGYSQPSLQAGSEYFLDISVTLASDTSWADAGYEIAFEQFVVPWDAPDAPQSSLSDMSGVSYSTSGSEVTVSGSDFTYVFDTSAGRFTSFQRHGEELLNAGPQLNAWREPVHNESAGWGGAEADEWTSAGLDALTATVDASSVSQPDPSAVRIEVETTDSASGHSEAFTTGYTYDVLGSGDVVVQVEVTPNTDMQNAITEYLPKYGLQLRMPADFDTFEWFGRGPGETYPDRKWNERIGRYSGSVSDQFVGYVPPGDYGNKCDTRYAALTNDSGVGLLVHGLPSTETMNVSVQAFTDMSDAERVSDLQFADGIVFNVDYAVSGVGGMPRNTLSAYSVDPISERFSYAFRPFDASSDDPLSLSRRDLPYAGQSGSGPITEGTYYVENVNSGKAMDIANSSTADGGNVQQYGYWGGSNQQWDAVRNGDGTYRFENVNSGKVLSVDSGSTSEGATLVQWTWNGNDEQRWAVNENSDGTYRLENVNSGYVADVNAASTSNGADVIQWGWGGGDNQKWTFNAP
ncbi:MULTISPECIES: glycoside hydrolase family 2 TIM barrel-domain containing protein [Haloferax]|nr:MULTISPECIES: glycoside hydrolase family 2 TIM barrel-domain containing protein [Haloferax]MDS0243265.1 RICIN domain-containing protein [Haloferax sp. S2CR25]MDS0446386.1 RICIN domain-containing protein [Haloferax sp. S2CR25-2]